MVVGIDKDNIEAYNKMSSKQNRILNRAYNRYKRNFDLEKFKNLTPEEVKKLSAKLQEKWFAVKKNESAGPILGGIAGVASLPMLTGTIVLSPIATGAGVATSIVGSEIGGNIGKKVDMRRHNTTNNELLGEIIGGTAFAPISKIVYNSANKLFSEPISMIKGRIANGPQIDYSKLHPLKWYSRDAMPIKDVRIASPQD